MPFSDPTLIESFAKAALYYHANTEYYLAFSNKFPTDFKDAISALKNNEFAKISKLLEARPELKNISSGSFLVDETWYRNGENAKAQEAKTERQIKHYGFYLLIDLLTKIKTALQGKNQSSIISHLLLDLQRLENNYQAAILAYPDFLQRLLTPCMCLTEDESEILAKLYYQVKESTPDLAAAINQYLQFHNVEIDSNALSKICGSLNKLCSVLGKGFASAQCFIVGKKSRYDLKQEDFGKIQKDFEEVRAELITYFARFSDSKECLQKLQFFYRLRLAQFPNKASFWLMKRVFTEFQHLKPGQKNIDDTVYLRHFISAEELEKLAGLKDENAYKFLSEKIQEIDKGNFYDDELQKFAKNYFSLQHFETVAISNLIEKNTFLRYFLTGLREFSMAEVVEKFLQYDPTILDKLQEAYISVLKDPRECEKFKRFFQLSTQVSQDFFTSPEYTFTGLVTKAALQENTRLIDLLTNIASTPLACSMSFEERIAMSRDNALEMAIDEVVSRNVFPRNLGPLVKLYSDIVNMAGLGAWLLTQIEEPLTTSEQRSRFKLDLTTFFQLGLMGIAKYYQAFTADKLKINLTHIFAVDYSCHSLTLYFTQNFSARSDSEESLIKFDPEEISLSKERAIMKMQFSRKGFGSPFCREKITINCQGQPERLPELKYNETLVFEACQQPTSGVAQLMQRGNGLLAQRAAAAIPMPADTSTRSTLPGSARSRPGLG
ncbi:MAG: hypothetical protein K0S08_1475 [Gammaproteobacteria bacterium]|jgi:hypothetical protein|nr:hypothetical protein [Gammaproteobacteria bacterium]